MLEDTHREKAPANETPALTKCTNAGIWVIGTYIKSTLYKRFFLKLKQYFERNKVVTGKTPFFVIGPFVVTM